MLGDEEKILWKYVEPVYIGKKKWYKTAVPAEYRADGDVVFYDKFYYFTDKRIIAWSLNVNRHIDREIPKESYNLLQSDLIAIPWENIGTVDVTTFISHALNLQMGVPVNGSLKPKDVLTLIFRTFEDYSTAKQMLASQLHLPEFYFEKKENQTIKREQTIGFSLYTFIWIFSLYFSNPWTGIFEIFGLMVSVVYGSLSVSIFFLKRRFLEKPRFRFIYQLLWYLGMVYLFIHS